MLFQNYKDSAVVHWERVSNFLFAKIRKKGLKQSDFSIISNNCWGGHVYRRYGLPYLSPTVGLYFFSEDYIRFVADLSNYCKQPLRFIPYKSSKHRNELLKRGQTNVPIGILGDDVEIVFLHYSSEKEAYEKWTRRCERINYGNLIIKISEMNGCTHTILESFKALPYTKKVAFVTQKTKEQLNYGILVKRYANEERVLNDTTYYAKHIDLKQLINGDIVEVC